MTQAYPTALRRQIVSSVTAGISRRAAAQLFDVSLGFVVKLMQRWYRDGTFEPKLTHTHLLTPHSDRVWSMVVNRPCITIDDIHRQLTLDGVRVSRAAVWRYLAAIGLTRAKRRSIRMTVGSRLARRRRGARDGHSAPIEHSA